MKVSPGGYQMQHPDEVTLEQLEVGMHQHHAWEAPALMILRTLETSASVIKNIPPHVPRDIVMPLIAF